MNKALKLKYWMIIYGISDLNLIFIIKPFLYLIKKALLFMKKNKALYLKGIVFEG